MKSPGRVRISLHICSFNSRWPRLTQADGVACNGADEAWSVAVRREFPLRISLWQNRLRPSNDKPIRSGRQRRQPAPARRRVSNGYTTISVVEASPDAVDG